MAGDIKYCGMPGSEIAEWSVILMATWIILFVGIFAMERKVLRQGLTCDEILIFLEDDDRLRL